MIDSNLYEINIAADKRKLYSYSSDGLKEFNRTDAFVQISKAEFVSNIQNGHGKVLENTDYKYIEWLIKKAITRKLGQRDYVVALDIRSGNFGISSTPFIRRAEYSILRNCSFRILRVRAHTYLMIDVYPKLYNRLTANKLVNEFGMPNTYLTQVCNRALIYTEYQGQRQWMSGIIRDIVGKNALVEVPNVFDGTISVILDRVLPLLKSKDYSELMIKSKIIPNLEGDLDKNWLDTFTEKEAAIRNVFREVFLPILKELQDEIGVTFADNHFQLNDQDVQVIKNSDLPSYSIERRGHKILATKLLQGLSSFDLADKVKTENVIVFFREEDKQKIRDLIVKLNEGITSGNYFFSFPSKFGIKLNVIKHYEIPRDSSYLEIVKTYIQSSSDDLREALVLCYLEPKSDIYYQVKALLASKGRMSQVVSRESFDIYSCWNIATNIYAKLGFVPWSIEDTQDDLVDLVLGLSYSSLIHKGRLKRNIGHVNVFDRSGIWKFMKSNSEYLSFENRHREIPKLINNAIADYLSTNDRIKFIDIHFSKKISGKERKLIIDSVTSKHPSVEQINLISLNIGHYFNFFNLERNGKIEKGTIINLGENRFLLSTSSDRNSNRFIEVTVWRSDSAELKNEDIVLAAKKILTMTMLNWKSAVKETTEPVTTKFSSEVAKLTNYFDLTEWKEVNDNLSTLPWFI